MEYHAAETVVNHYGEFSGRAGLCAQHGDGNAGGFTRGFLHVDTLKKLHALRTARPEMAALLFRSGGRDCLYRKACAHSVLLAPDTLGISNKDVLGNLQKAGTGLRDGWGVCFCCLCRQPEVFRLLGFGSVFRIRMGLIQGRTVSRQFFRLCCTLLFIASAQPRAICIRFFSDISFA